MKGTDKSQLDVNLVLQLNLIKPHIVTENFAWYLKRKPEKFFNENIWNWNFLFKLSPSDHLWCTWQSGRLLEGFAYEKCSLWAGVVFFLSDHNNQILQIGSGWVQLTPDNSNPRLLEPPANSDQNRFSLDFLHTFNVILPSATRTSR